MDFELQHNLVNCYESVLDTTICQEETQEAIVPDACPDILRILDARAYACLTGKQVRDNLITVTGLIRTSVFYLPEGETGVRHLEIATPFTCQTDAHGISNQGMVLAFPAVRWAEARALNPRKILLRVDLAVGIRALQPGQMNFCCAARSESSVGLRQLFSNETIDIISDVQEKTFTFSDAVDFSTLNSSHGEVLNIHGTPCCHESRLIGNKLIFKGTVELDVLLCVGSELKAIRQSMPYSQIMEIPGVGDNCSCEVRVALADLSFQPDDNFANSGMITLELLAQAIVLENCSITLLSDLYSTSFFMETRAEAHTLNHFLEQNIKTTPVRELLETTTMVRTVAHGWADLGELYVVREGDQSTITVQVQINVIYQDDAEQFQSVHKTIPVCCTVDCPVGGKQQCWCAAPTELFISPAAGGLEIRFSQDFHCITSQTYQTTAIVSAELGDERSKSDELQPSIILRLAAPGERLWDIAKHYATTEEEIVQANELESDVLPIGKMLLIPRAR